MTVSPELGVKLETYYRLLAIWNQKINLTGIDLMEPNPDAVDRLPFERTCECASALKYALITRPDAIPAETARDLAPLVAKYLQRT